MAQDVSVLYGIKDAGDLTFTNLTTNEPELYIGYANSVQIDLTSDTVYAYAKGAKAVSWHCRNHGECEWCRRNRTYNTLRDLIKFKDLEKEFKNESIK